MAAILGATYPDLFAAAGVHSGLPHGAATDLPSAFAAMSGGAKAARARRRATGSPHHRLSRRTDKTVDPSNGEAILDDVRARLAEPAEEMILDGVAGGRAYNRTIIADASGVAQAERRAVEALGHAWSGGSPEGAYTDPKGPDASREMLRFFLETA